MVRAGQLIAQILQGVWREEPPPVDTIISASTVRALQPLLHANAVWPLTWWRLHCGAGAVSLDMERVKWKVLAQGLACQQRMEGIARALRQGDVEAVVSKGWALAVLYPRLGLRPYRDIDLTVRPGQMARAKALLADAGYMDWCDLKEGWDDLNGRTSDAVYTRSRVAPVGQEQIRTLGHEDHLRLVCLHYQRHGGGRALWLCDVALLLETRPSNFDWPYFLSGPPRQIAWTICVLALAHHLLGARLDDTPLVERERRLPRWLVPSILSAWEHPGLGVSDPMERLPGEDLPTLVRRRWATPMQAAWRFDLAPSSPLIRPIQTGRFVGRMVRDAVRRGQQTDGPGASAPGIAAMTETL